MRDGTTVGCIGRCKACGKAIVLMATYVDGSQFWAHFGVGPAHYAVLSPGVIPERPLSVTETDK